MKVLIILFICIAVAFGGTTDWEKRIDELLRIASNECVLEMHKDPSFIAEAGAFPSNDPRLVEDPLFTMCLDKKMGVLTEDGTYSLERILSYSETPEVKQRVENIYNTRIRDCTKLHGKNTCKLVACVHRSAEPVCDGTPIEDLLPERNLN